MAGPIVCGVDDSRSARAAATVAMALSRRIGARLILVHIVAVEPARPFGRPTSPDGRRRRTLERGRELLEQVSAGAGWHADAAALRVGVGAPAERLAAVASTAGAEMLVVGSRGRGALSAALLGSVSRELLVLSPCPVLVVPPGAAVPRASGHGNPLRPPSVLCGIDGSPESRRAAEAASRLARRMGTRLVLAHAYRPATTWAEAGLARRYTSGPLRAQWRAGLERLEAVAGALPEFPEPGLSLEAGDPSQELIRIAGRERAEVLALGSHGQGKLQSALYGSVAGTLAASAPIPVLVVPPKRPAIGHATRGRDGSVRRRGVGSTSRRRRPRRPAG